MQSLNIPDVTLANVDWSSLCWVVMLACITAAVMWVKSAYARIADMGPVPRVLAHVTIGYFGVGMTAFGVVSALRGSLPVPGGVAWEGAVAVIGGLAALVIGASTLAEHVAHCLAMNRASDVGGARTVEAVATHGTTSSS